MAIKFNGATISPSAENLQPTDFAAVTARPEFVLKGKTFYDEAGQLRVGEYIGGEIFTMTELLNMVYPIGALYVSESATSPAELFGGTWERLKDRFLLAASATYSAGTTGGAKSVILGINNLPSHAHNVILSRDSSALYTRDGIVQAQVTGGWHRGVTSNPTSNDGTVITDYTGESKAHENMPPYLAVYMWKRTA